MNVVKFVFIILALTSSITCIGSENLAHSIIFRSIAEPVSDEDRRAVHVTRLVSINGKDYPVGFHRLITTNDQKDGGVFGQLFDINGDLLTDIKGEPEICRQGSGPDFTSLHNVDGQLLAITQLECNTGGAYVRLSGTSR